MASPNGWHVITPKDRKGRQLPFRIVDEVGSLVCQMNVGSCRHAPAIAAVPDLVEVLHLVKEAQAGTLLGSGLVDRIDRLLQIVGQELRVHAKTASGQAVRS